MPDTTNRRLSAAPADTTPGLATVDQAAEFLACTPAAVRKWLAQGRLARVKLGSLTRVARADLARIAREGLPARRPHAHT